MKIIFAGGGTGGHLMPARNLAEWLHADREEHEVRFLLAGRPVETSFFDDRPWPLVALFEGRRKRPSLFNWSVWWRAIKRVRMLISSFEPDALILTGGYVSLPALLAWGVRRNPVYVFEQNAVPGKTVRLARWRARRIFCHFEAGAERFKRKALVTGSPLPPSYSSGGGTGTASTARRALGLKEGLATLLVAGGSQGARAINNLVLKNLPVLAEHGKGMIQILHITGHADFERVKAGYADTGVQGTVWPFLDPMGRAYRAADLVLCRGGGMTIAEITAMGLPAVIVPYPHHRDRHQFQNASEMVQTGAAHLVEERAFSAEIFKQGVIDLLVSPKQLEEMARSSRGLGRLSGGPRILEVIRADLEDLASRNK